MKHRCAVAPDRPNTGGSCAQARPDVDTKTIAATYLTIAVSASTAALRTRERPGATRWNSSHE
jgi:hypothetical protein